MLPSDKNFSIINKLELERKSDSSLFKDSKFKPENMPRKKPATVQIKVDNLGNSPKDIFGNQSQISRREIYQSLLKDPELLKQAIKEGKKPWQLAKELTDNFPKEFGGIISKSEAKKEINFNEYWKIIHEQKEGHIDFKKSKKIKHEKEEREFLKKKFGV